MDSLPSQQTTCASKPPWPPAQLSLSRQRSLAFSILPSPFLPRFPRKASLIFMALNRVAFLGAFIVGGEFPSLSSHSSFRGPLIFMALNREPPSILGYCSWMYILQKAGQGEFPFTFFLWVFFFHHSPPFPVWDFDGPPSPLSPSLPLFSSRAGNPPHLYFSCRLSGGALKKPPK